MNETLKTKTPSGKEVVITRLENCYKIEVDGHEERPNSISFSVVPVLGGNHAKISYTSVVIDMREIDKVREFVAKIENAKKDNIPGLAELTAAIDAVEDDQYRYERESENMFATGHSICPKPVDSKLINKVSELKAMCPRAAMYLKAKSYTGSDNVHKYGAGKKAMALISEGGEIDKAEEILKNWLPETAIWD